MQLKYLKNITLSNQDQSIRNIRIFISEKGEEYRYNLLYNIYCSTAGIILDQCFNPIEIYITKSNTERNYKAFNLPGHQRVYVHRIVAYLYCDNYDKTLHVDHKNNDPLDCYYQNLQYLTKKDNVIKEIGIKVKLYNYKNNTYLNFNCKKDMFNYFKISEISLNYFYKRYLNLNMTYYNFINVYLTELKFLSLHYYILDNLKASQTVDNTIYLISNYVLIDYKYNCKYINIEETDNLH